MHFVLPGSPLEMANRTLARLPQGARFPAPEARHVYSTANGRIFPELREERHVEAWEGHAAPTGALGYA